MPSQGKNWPYFVVLFVLQCGIQGFKILQLKCHQSQVKKEALNNSCNSNFSRMERFSAIVYHFALLLLPIYDDVSSRNSGPILTTLKHVTFFWDQLSISASKLHLTRLTVFLTIPGSLQPAALQRKEDQYSYQQCVWTSSQEQHLYCYCQYLGRETQINNCIGKIWIGSIG